jgi:hypothetical protein
MKPVKAVSLFFYTVVSIVAIGVTVSHLWNVRKEWRNEESRSASLRFTLSDIAR